jgi:formylglycine-generating enzyme required for sulfatase activity
MVASTLGRLGDPRFAPDRWYLPDDEMLGFVEIPAGPLPTRSGTLTDDNDLPQHKVPLPTYHIARWPVTVAQFKSFVDDPDNGGFEPGDPASVRGVPNHPVVNVSWHEALLYCRWLTTRLISSESTPKALRDLLSRDNELAMQVTLPSEAEWQEATRGTNEDWGTAVPYAMGGRHAVGCFPDARSTYGVEEVAGNVWELTRTGSSGCTFAPDFGVTDWTVKGKTDSVRAVGGRLTNISLAIGKFVRSCSPDERVKDVGFRVVVSPLFSYLGPFPKV